MRAITYDGGNGMSNFENLPKKKYVYIALVGNKCVKHSFFVRGKMYNNSEVYLYD